MATVPSVQGECTRAVAVAAGHSLKNRVASMGCTPLLSAQLIYTSASWAADYIWGFSVTPTPGGPQCTELTRWNWFSRTAQFSMAYNAISGGAVVQGLAIIVNSDPNNGAHVNSAAITLGPLGPYVATSNCSFPRVIPPLVRLVCQYQVNVPLSSGSGIPAILSLNIQSDPPFCPVSTTAPVQYNITSTCGYLYAGDQPPLQQIRQYCVQNNNGVLSDYEALADDPACGTTQYSRMYRLQFPSDPSDNKQATVSWCAHKTC
eukprot:m51a1_g10927 hypothetical protein (261) ;mRNA; f:126126-129355